MGTACTAALRARYWMKLWVIMCFRKAGKPAYTARLEIRFRSAIRIGETVKVEGWPEVHRGRLFIMKGKITHADGTPAAEAKAEMMLAK